MMTKEEKHTHVANLIKVAKADRELTQEEVMFIKSIAIKLEISSNEFNQIALNSESIKEATPFNQDIKIKLFYDVLTLMIIDTDAHEEEEQLCKEIGKTLGFNEAQIYRAIKLSKENLETVVTPDQIAEIIQ
jgi:uncharacterized tellurite resistance protein B-like protein